MYAQQIRSQILNLGQNILHIQIKCPVSNLTIRQMCRSRLKQYLHITNQVTDTKFGPKYFVHTDQMSGLKSDNRKDPSAHPGHPVYNILHNKIQIWTFDSDNRIDPLWEFNYVLGFFIQTDSTFNSNYFIKSFQHLTS